MFWLICVWWFISFTIKWDTHFRLIRLLNVVTNCQFVLTNRFSNKHLFGQTINWCTFHWWCEKAKINNRIKVKNSWSRLYQILLAWAQFKRLICFNFASKTTINPKNDLFCANQQNYFFTDGNFQFHQVNQHDDDDDDCYKNDKLCFWWIIWFDINYYSVIG